ncbi:unnamed protein product [Calypogeia fissa]
MAKSLVFLGLLLATVMVHTVVASDPDLTTDFNVTNPVAEDFAFRKFHNLPPAGKGVATPHFAQFNMDPPFVGLNGLGLAAVLFEFGPESQIDPHTHPRATEMFFVLSGEVQVGFVDTANNFKYYAHVFISSSSRNICLVSRPSQVPHKPRPGQLEAVPYAMH